MNTYTFKRGVVRSPESWTVDEQGFSRADGSEHVAWGSITEARFSDAPSGRMNILELVLKTGTDSVALQCNDRRGGESRHSFLRMCRAITEQLERSNPEVRFMPTTGFQILAWGMAGLGLAAIIWGLYFVGVGLFDWGNNGAGFAIGMGSFAVLFGIFLAWSGSPWEKPEPKTPLETREWIDRIIAMG